MYTVLLSGGSGKRLWPLSNDMRPKQYIKFLSEKGHTERISMLQHIFRQLACNGLAENTIITASPAQSEIIASQLGKVHLAVEPRRRDTFPAIAISCAYLSSELHADCDDVVCVLPVDPFTENEYFDTIKLMEAVLQDSEADIVLMGKTPTEPSPKYGYIMAEIGENREWVSVKGFREKPTEHEANALIKLGAMWNCGVFCFRIGKMLDIILKHGINADYKSVYEEYNRLPKISFDYEVLEKEVNIVAVRYDGKWKDLGTWDALSEQMDSEIIGDGLVDQCVNTNVINEMQIPVVVSGVDDVMVVAAPDGILVTKKSSSEKVKNIVESLADAPRFEEHRWGTVTTMDRSEGGKKFVEVQKIEMRSGEESPERCCQEDVKFGIVLSGEGHFISNDSIVPLEQGCEWKCVKGQCYRICSIDSLSFIQTSFNEITSVTDS